MRVLKITANKIIIAIVVLFCIVILAAKLPCSHVGLTFELDNAEAWSEAEISARKTDGDVFRQDTLVDSDKISFSVVESYPMKCMSVDIESEEAKVRSVTMTSRNYSVYNWSGSSLEDNISYQNKEGKTSFSVSDEFINKYNQIYKYDWKLKVDILIPVILVFLYFELAYFVIKRMKLSQAGIVITVLVFVCGLGIYSIISSATNQTYLKVDTYVEPVGVSSVITEDEVYKQMFYTYDESICGLSVCFASYGTQLSNDYVLKVYDADTKTVVVQEKIIGKDIIEGADQEILFDDTLEKNHEYYFSISAIYSEDEAIEEDTLVMWMSDGDQYKEGVLYKNNSKVDADIAFNLIAEGPKNINWILIFIGVFTLAMITALIYHWFGMSRNIAKLIIYILIFVLCILKINYYYQYLDLGMLDETAQISYIAYLDEVDRSVIPDFEDMTLLMPYNKEMAEDPNNFYPFEQTDGVYTGMFTGTVNYLGHPPLYYSLMRLTGSITADENYVYVDLLPLRLFNMMIVLSAIIIMFYIGFTRIKRKPIYHMLFAMLCTSVPLLCYEACMINNDNLALLTVVIFILGALRFVENKINYTTYFILAFGIALSMLTKTTAGLIVLLTAIIYLLWTSIKHRSFNLILNKYFAATLPIYILPLMYFIIMYVKYGTFQPALSSYAYEQYVNYPAVYIPIHERDIVEFWGMMKRFYNAFVSQWQQGVMWEEKYTGWANIATGLLWVFPVAYMLISKVNKRKVRLYFSMTISIFITLCMQLIRAFNDFQYISGHGSAQSRYYLCSILILSLIAVEFICEIFDNNRKLFKLYSGNNKTIIFRRDRVGVVVSVIYCIVLLYAEVICNLMSSVRYNF